MKDGRLMFWQQIEVPLGRDPNTATLYDKGQLSSNLVNFFSKKGKREQICTYCNGALPSSIPLETGGSFLEHLGNVPAMSVPQHSIAFAAHTIHLSNGRCIKFIGQTEIDK